jgi:YHS domain-containing protein
MSTISKSALAVAFMLGFATTAYAATGQFSNMCSWGLANHKDVPTDCSVDTSIKGKTYCFSSQEAKANFMKNPTANLAKAESFYKSEHKG